MRILGLTNLYPNPFQPHRAPFNRDKFRLLSQQNTVRIIAPILWTDEFHARRSGAPPLSRSRQIMADNVLTEHPRYWYTPRTLRRFYGHFYEASVKRTFRRAVAEFQPDLVLATWAYPDGWAAVRLARSARLPVVIQIHGSDVMLLNDFPSRRQRTAEALQSADGIIAVSQALADRVVSLGARRENVAVIYNGVDHKLFHPGCRKEAINRLGLVDSSPLLLFVGSLVPVKGPDVLLDAAAHLHHAGDRFQLTLIGTGPDRSRLEAQAKQLGIANSVRFIGNLDQRELPNWYRAANLLVLPSRSEGVPNVLLEAIACGTPFVATEVGGIPEIAHLGASRLVPPSRPDLLAEAMGQMLHQPPASPANTTRNQQVVAQEMSALLERVLTNSQRFRDNVRAMSCAAAATLL